MELYRESDLQLIVEQYMLPLMNLHKMKPKVNFYECKPDNSDIVSFMKSSNKGMNNVRLLVKSNEKNYYIEIETPFEGIKIKLVRDVWKEMISIRKHVESFDDRDLRIAIYDYTLKKSLCVWLSGNESTVYKTMFSLITSLEKWVFQTNEGDDVDFSLGLNIEESQGDFDYIDFLKNDYSASFTNSTTSGVIIDKNGNYRDFLDYNSQVISKFDQITAPSNNQDIIYSFISKGCKYIFILNLNKEIMIFKNGELILLKKHNNWHLVNFHSFYDVLYSYYVDQNSPNQQRDCYRLFNSLLDMSITGHGCGLGLIKKDSAERISNLINDIDKLQSDSYNSKDYSYAKIQKRKFLEKYAKMNFLEMSPYKRRELLSMDGATIIDEEGTIYCVGAILQAVTNNGVGGARSAAMRKIAEYGLGIKVSSDGGITVLKQIRDIEVVFSLK